MRGLATRSLGYVLIVVCVVASLTAFGGRSQAPSATVTWTKISTKTGLGLASAGLWRTSDGRLHVIWPRHDSTSYSLHYSTLSAKAKLINSGSVVGKWAGVSFTPRLLSGANGGMRLLFAGGDGKQGSLYNTGAVYSATTGKAGRTWSLAAGSLSHQNVGISLTDETAAVYSGKPVAGWASGNTFGYHIGIDPNSPATAPDKTFGISSGVVVGPAMARNKDGSVAVAWFTSSGLANQGYWVRRLLPSRAAMVKAPKSGGKGLTDNQPRQVVAFTGRVGGGEYLAYCVPTKLIPCGHIALWKAGASKAITVPRSATGHASHVAIAAAPKGHLWIAWYDSGLNKIRVVRTTASARGFGSVRTIAAPPRSNLSFTDLQAEARTGPVDLIALTDIGDIYWAAHVPS